MSETEELENYLAKKQMSEDYLITEARLLINKEFHKKLYWQKQTYSLIQHFGRKKLKEEIETVHAKLFTEKKFEKFRQKISFIFKTNL